MNRKSRFTASVAIVALLLIGLILWKQRHNEPLDSSSTNNVSPPLPEEAIRPPIQSDTNTAPTSANSQPGDSPFTNRDERFKQIVEGNNTLINFWGKVVDQDGNPIPGAKVGGDIRQWQLTETYDIAGKNIPFTLETKPDGTFEVLNVKGDVLEIVEIAKDGYRLSPKSWMASNFKRGATSSPNDPAIYKMWKTGIPEALVKYEKSTRVPYNGTPIIFDLLDGNKSTNNANGDVRVILLRSPLQVQPGGKKPYNWTATIEAIDGGVIQSDDEFMFRAPETGYQPKIEINMSALDTNWSPTAKLSFYLKSRAGQCFGRLSVEFYTDSAQPTTGFKIDSVVNPSGSRNLE